MGHIVEEMQLGEAKIYFCDDYCKDVTQEQVEKILERIAANMVEAIKRTA